MPSEPGWSSEGPRAKASSRSSASGRSVRPKPRRKWLPAVAELRARQQQDALGLDEAGRPVVDRDAGHRQPREADRAGARPDPGEAVGPVVEEGVEALEVRGHDPARPVEDRGRARAGR